MLYLNLRASGLHFIVLVPALPLFMWVRRLSFAAAISVMVALALPKAAGQNPPSPSPHAMEQKRKPKKVWTEDDLAGLWKPWDLYQIAQEKRATLVGVFKAIQQSPAILDNSMLRMMDNIRFSRFLRTLDTDILKWEARLRNINVASLAVEFQEQKEIESSYDSCREALNNTREDIAKLAEKQTLKLDLLLLLDLNALARNLDGLSVNLASPLTLQEMSAAKKSLRWAKDVLEIDKELASHITAFQYHVLAFAALQDATSKSAEQVVDRGK